MSKQLYSIQHLNITVYFLQVAKLYSSCLHYLITHIASLALTAGLDQVF